MRRALFDKFDGINCRPKFGPKLLDASFIDGGRLSWTPDLGPAVKV